MPVILADSIDGGIFALLIFCGGAATSILALMALVPATRGNKPLTLVMIAPAIAAGLLVTAWLGYGYITTGLHDPESDFAHDFFMPWLFLAGPAFVTSLITACVLWSKCRRVKQNL